jgi:hypothetical protein
MLANVFNSCDPVLIQSFIDFYTAPDAAMAKKCPPPYTDGASGNAFMDKNTAKRLLPELLSMEDKFGLAEVEAASCATIYAQGIDLISTYWATILSMHEDYVMRFGNTQIIHSPTNLYSKVHCDYVMTMTHMYLIHPVAVLIKQMETIFGDRFTGNLMTGVYLLPETIDDSIKVDSSDNNNGMSDSLNNKRFKTATAAPISLPTKRRYFPHPLDNYVLHGRGGKLLELLEEPKQITFHGRLSLTLDENKRIIKYDFVVDSASRTILNKIAM